MLNSTAVAAILVALALAGCGSSSSSSTSSSPASSSSSSAPAVSSNSTASVTTTAQKPDHAPSPCLTTKGYAGLYSPVSAFNGDHDTTAPSQPTPGIAWYTVLSTDHGCVSAYSVDEVTQPPQGASDIVFLTDGIYLPDDHTQPVEQGGCIVFESRTLTKATRFKFAKAVGTAQEGGTPAHAEIRLTNDGTCP